MHAAHNASLMSAPIKAIPLISHRDEEHRPSSLSALREVASPAEPMVILGAADLTNPNGSRLLTGLCRGLQKKYRGVKILCKKITVVAGYTHKVRLPADTRVPHYHIGSPERVEGRRDIFCKYCDAWGS